MSDNKKYYYLKLKDNFFDDESIILLETMKDGYIYQNILLKLYLKSLKNEGRLAFRNMIPYNTEMLATLTRHQVGTVKRALEIFEQLDLIEVLDNGIIYMNDIQNFIGESSTEGDRKRKYRKKIEEEKNKLVTNVQENWDKCPDKCPTNVHQRLEIRDKRLEIRDYRLDCNQEESFPHSFPHIYPKIVEKWNSINEKKITSIKSDKRIKSTQSIINQYSLDIFLDTIDKIKESDFLQGDNKDGWIITFDWFIKEKNFTKVMNDEYKSYRSDKKSTGYTHKEIESKLLEKRKKELGY